MNANIKLNKDLGYLRVGAATPLIHVADIDTNVNAIIEVMKKASARGVQVLAFPELVITGYTIQDLMLHRALLTTARRGLDRIRQASMGLSMLVIVGMPLALEDQLFNCAVVLNAGRILAVIPKAYLSNYKEFYEDRWFAPSAEATARTMELLGQQVPFGTDILFELRNVPSAVIGVEICEDLWVPLSPHAYQALAGATVLINLSGSNEIIGKADWRRTMIVSESGRCIATYCYVSAGFGESSNDLIFGGHILLAENGTLLVDSDRFQHQPQLICVDVDTEWLGTDRWTTTSFYHRSTRVHRFRVISTEVTDIVTQRLRRPLDPHPFVPKDTKRRTERCREIFAMQVAALAQKLSSLRDKQVVLGVSGGLDSTLALLVAVKAMDFLELPRTNVHAYTLPGFGTTQRTKRNATQMSHALNVSFSEVDITSSCRSHLQDLHHTSLDDVVFENVQARYRTEFLFNKANEIGGLVLGTGDLTEIALGWCTFSGDHLSHYHVNASVPKTLVRYLIQWVADEEMPDIPVSTVLQDILATPISPELKQPVRGEITQKSEDIIGPVELADFYLYPFIRRGTRPSKLLYLAHEVNTHGLFDTQYTLDELYIWLTSFLRRFFAYQFKRTCMPEGPKIGSVSLSPRGDWRMASDAAPNLWLDDVEEMYARLQKPHKPV